MYQDVVIANYQNEVTINSEWLLPSYLNMHLLLALCDSYIQFFFWPITTRIVDALPTP